MRRVYVDHNATSPSSPAHLCVLAELLQSTPGNPSSQHSEGRDAKVALEDARQAFAAIIGVRSQAVVFTSGATEANNIIIKGILGKTGDRKVRVIASAGDHSSVREAVAQEATRRDVECQWLQLDQQGQIDAAMLEDLLQKPTDLVCLLLAHNETGAIQPVAELATLIKSRQPTCHVHVDAVQALGKFDLSGLGAWAIDSAAFSGHKLGSLKGIGVLFLREGSKLKPLFAGGGQERARRPGTENMPGILSLGLIARDVPSRLADHDGWRHLQKSLIKELMTISGCHLHGDPTKGLAQTVSFHIDGVSGDDLLLNLDLAGVAASSGSACSSGVGRPSHALLAMGYSEWIALNSVRISFGSEFQAEDIGVIVDSLRSTVARVRSIK